MSGSKRDIRKTELYREAEVLYKCMRQPGTGQLSDAAEVHAAPNGKYAVFSGTIVDVLEGTPPTRICSVDLTTGAIRVLTFGPNIDRLPKYSPDGRHIAFLSDREKKGDFRLYLLDAFSSEARSTPQADGWIEYLHWSPDGTRILLGLAGHGADIAGGQGAVTSKQAVESLPSWAPTVETSDESFRWRRVWIYELASNTVRQVSPAHLNVWEAVWCGNDSIAAVVSPAPGEGHWYSATLNLIDVKSADVRDIYKPLDQLGWPAGSPSGNYLAVVDAVCSDRWIVAGDLMMIETVSGRTERIDTHGVDVSCGEWKSERTLLLAGHRGFDTVVGMYDVMDGSFKETWVSRDITTGGRYATASALNEVGDCVLVCESFTRAPEIGVIRAGEYWTVKSFDLGYSEYAKAIESVRCITWQAPDSLEIQGWLLEPKGNGPHPLVLNVHGGPVWQSRPTWLGRNGGAFLLLLKRGYAIFMPNPRGSSGRGREFARLVLGDAGGNETTDHLSGIDHLVAEGIADPRRLGVTGGSHGGFMTSWIIAQDSRFAAAVPVAPITNWVSEHLICNIPHFCSIALGDTYANETGKYFHRSPIMHAHNVRTPTLHICGALDRCTPPSEAMQYHNALSEHRVKSVLVTYPEEGHGVRQFPAMIDYVARVLEWFERHMGAA